MSLLDRIFAEPELRDSPPVLVDVGAAGGLPRSWRRIARHAIGVGFEPDPREAPAPDAARRQFARWIFCPGLAVPEAARDGRAPLHLTKSPQCSSTLRPAADALGDWAFAEFFAVEATKEFPATTIAAALQAQGIARVDWLKCDTQGLDLRLFRSLPAEWRTRTLAVEFEPGVIDAYAGEDRLAEVLAAMAAEPFWLAEFRVNGTARGRAELLDRHLGAGGAQRARRLAPVAPGWVNLRYLRDVARTPEPLGRREFLLAWVFTSDSGQPAEALKIATAGAARFGGGLFDEMIAASARQLRWAMVRGLPAAIWRRLMRA
ncbi:MAG TPA: hypothetical protein PLB90_01780 [Opitutaceae bacterium]|nr:hypothetical protein [Opitutaceae bacterium]